MHRISMSMTRSSLVRLAFAALTSCSCGGGGAAGPGRGQGAAPSQPGTKACDPLAATPAKPTSLGQLVAIGRADDGTLYAVDRVANESEPRVFVSDGDQLTRRRVLGSGEVSDSGAQLLLLDVDAQPEPFTLAIEIKTSETRMATVDGATKANSFDALPNRHALEVLDKSAIAGKTLVGLSGETVIEYLAKATGGAWLLVIRPRDNWSYSDFRAFYGNPPSLAERHVDNVVRKKDGGSTTILFHVGSTQATASFPVMFSEDAGFEPGPATLELGGKSISLQLVMDPSASLESVHLLCR